MALMWNLVLHLKFQNSIYPNTWGAAHLRGKSRTLTVRQIGSGICFSLTPILLKTVGALGTCRKWAKSFGKLKSYRTFPGFQYKGYHLSSCLLWKMKINGPVSYLLLKMWLHKKYFSSFIIYCSLCHYKETGRKVIHKRVFHILSR